MLTKIEQETIITYNNEEKTANIYTYDRSLIKKIEDKKSLFPEVITLRKSDDFAEYLVPKKWIKVGFPKQFSSEQRQKLSERMKEVVRIKKGA